MVEAIIAYNEAHTTENAATSEYDAARKATEGTCASGSARWAAQ